MDQSDTLPPNFWFVCEHSVIFFALPKQIIQLTYLVTFGMFHINKQNIFCPCDVMRLEWGWYIEVRFSKYSYGADQDIFWFRW